MKIIFSGKNIEISDAVKEHTEKKLGKLDKFFQSEPEGYVKMENAKNRQIIEVTINLPNSTIIRAEEEGKDLYSALDRAIDVLERQIRKNKTKLQKKYKNNDTIRFENIVEEQQEEEAKVVKKKRFTVKPMSTDEAILQMELLRHNFFVYVNAETEEVEIVYQRKDGNYGLIEPVL